MHLEENYSKLLFSDETIESTSVVKIEAAKSAKFFPPTKYGSLDFPLADTAYPVDEMSYSELTVEKLSDIVILPNHIVLNSSDSSILPYTFMRNRLHHHGGLALQKDGSYESKFDLKDKDILKVDYPLYHADTDHPDVYGHVLLEVIPNLWAQDLITDKAMKIATSIKLSPGYLAMFDALGVKPERIERIVGPTYSPTVFLPSKTIQRRRFINPLARNTFDRIKNNLSYKSRIMPYERIYISRSKVNGRKLLNEKLVEDLFYSLGFEIIHPQELSIYDQVKLFSEAKYIAGSGGSAMHNTLFSNEECKVLIISSIGWVVVADSLICQVPDQLAYVFGTPDIMPGNTHRTQKDWTVNISEVKDAIRNHFGL
jgi:hypothetical protein